MVRSGDALGKDQPFAGNPLGNLSDTQQGSSARGNVECAHGVANFGVDFQHGKEPLAQGKKTCVFDAIDEGDGRIRGKGKLKTLLWVWKGHLMKVKTEVGRPCRKFWKVWRFWAAFQSLGRPVSPSLLGGRKAWALKCKPRPKCIHDGYGCRSCFTT